MTKKSNFVLGCLLIITKANTACQQSGCTDPQATNYNPNADYTNGNCLYISDKFVGNYLAKDTMYINVSPNVVNTTPQQGTFAIAAAQRNDIKLLNFAQCPEVYATVSQTTMAITGSADGCFSYNNTSFFVRDNGQTIVYRYELFGSNPNGIDYVSGVATKQP